MTGNSFRGMTTPGRQRGSLSYGDRYRRGVMQCATLPGRLTDSWPRGAGRPAPSPRPGQALPSRAPRAASAGYDEKQYESLDASPPCSRIWCTRRPRNASPSTKNRSSNAIPLAGLTSSLAIQAPTPSG